MARTPTQILRDKGQQAARRNINDLLGPDETLDSIQDDCCKERQAIRALREQKIKAPSPGV